MHTEATNGLLDTCHLIGTVYLGLERGLKLVLEQHCIVIDLPCFHPVCFIQ
uniref:Uncharacterized protein n=1 Tax=Anguilla anguilla TaxID=7936 RepID=A0A0E9VDJ4_ANGAN